MNKIKLTASDLSILGHLELDADLPLTELAKKLRKHSVVVHRQVRRLIERGVVLGKTAVFDVSMLGLIEYGFYLVLGPRTEQLRKKFLDFLALQSGVSWMAEIGGEFDLALNVLARHPREVLHLFEQCTTKFPGLIVRKEMVQRTTRIRCFRGYLGGRRGIRFRMGEPDTLISLSTGERKIVQCLDSMTFESFRELAQRNGVSVATFTRSIRQFKELGFLKGFGYRLNTEKLGRLQFRMMITFKHINHRSIITIEKLLPSLEGAKLLVRCLGAWDYEIEFDAVSQSAARELSTKIWGAFGEDLSSVRVVPIFEHIRYVSFGTELARCDV
jgi:DNA-binding Lrp family transcriptional regulator